MQRILVIDDEELVRLLVQEALESEGYEVSSAANGVEGLKQHARLPFDLIITDIVMPDKDGLETIMEIRQCSPDTPIIAMSGGGNWLAPGKCLDLSKKLGAYKALRKPVTPETLLQVVEEAFYAS